MPILQWRNLAGIKPDAASPFTTEGEEEDEDHAERYPVPFGSRHGWGPD